MNLFCSTVTSKWEKIKKVSLIILEVLVNCSLLCSPVDPTVFCFCDVLGKNKASGKDQKSPEVPGT